ncbi:MAG: response regulator transcription factor [Proteobacteria bacterium]|nr:response regulator transcription factor [Pseudomonadota bacterium]
MRLLLVEDDNLLASGLAAALRQSGYAVDWASRGDQADRWLSSEDYDLVLLDLGLPGLDGAEVLCRLRNRKTPTPVLVLSARETIDERVRTLDLGADDYLVKPVELAELEARIRVLLRRGRADTGPTIELGALQLDTVGRRVYMNGEPQDFSSREWQVLNILVSRVGRIVSKDQMLQSLFGWEEGVTLNAIEKAISRLRAKLETGGVNIRTVRGLGYMLEKPGKPDVRDD